MGKGQRAVAALSPALIIVIVAGMLLFAAVTNEGPGKEPTLAEIATELTPRVAEGVEQVRGLPFESVPAPEVVTADDLNRLTAAELRKPGVRERLEAEEVVAKFLGLVEFDDDLLGVAEESGDLAAAAYDPRTDELYVVEDAVGVSPALVEFVLAHELNHALEDQHYDLSDRLGTGDRELALSSLVEGTATVAMIRYAAAFRTSSPSHSQPVVSTRAPRASRRSSSTSCSSPTPAAPGSSARFTRRPAAGPSSTTPWRATRPSQASRSCIRASTC